MITKAKDPATTEIIIPCGCRTEKIIISKFDDDCDYYYLEFWVDSFYPAQRLRSIFWDRLKMAWLSLRKGNYIHQEILLDLSTVKELKTDLEKFISEADQKTVI